MDSSALEDSTETDNDAHTGNEYMQKKAEDRRFRGNQLLAYGDMLLERYVFGSGEVVHFLTHSRKAPSRVDRVQYTDLAAVRRLFTIKL